MPTDIVLDTNFLLIPGQFGVDIFDELEKRLDFPFRLCIVSGTLKELEKIQKTGNGKDRKAAKLAEGILKTKTIKTIVNAPDMHVDDVLALLSAQGSIIATQDIELRKRLSGKKIILRQKKYLALEE